MPDLKRTHLEISWSTDDPQLQTLLRTVAKLPVYSSERLAAEAALCSFHAQWCHTRIGRAEAEQAMADRNRRAARARVAKTQGDVL